MLPFHVLINILCTHSRTSHSLSPRQHASACPSSCHFLLHLNYSGLNISHPYTRPCTTQHTTTARTEPLIKEHCTITIMSHSLIEQTNSAHHLVSLAAVGHQQTPGPPLQGAGRQRFLPPQLRASPLVHHAHGCPAKIEG